MVIGNLINKMAMAKKFGKMGHSSKEYISKDVNMDRATLNGPTEPNTMEILEMMNSMVLVPILMPMAVCIKVSGIMDESTVKEFLSGLMEESTEENINMM